MLEGVYESRRLPKYTWERRGRHLIVCVGLAEISRDGIKSPWVIMVRLPTSDVGLKPWGLMPDSGGIRTFKSSKEAIKTAEEYLDMFDEYSRVYSGDCIDISNGNFRLAGSQA